MAQKSDEARKEYQRAYYRQNRTQRLANQKKYDLAHPLKKREHMLKKNYGLDLASFDALLLSQGGKCAICFTDTPGQKGVFHVDHDHTTGKVRGLLCHDCNTGIGKLKDSPKVLTSAIRYLEKHNGS